MSGSKARIFSLCTLVLTITAISAGNAQAEKGAFWLVNGAKISESLMPTVGGQLENNTGKLLAKLGANTFHITCTAGTSVGAHLVEPNGAAVGKVKFTGCKFFALNKGGAGEELKSCEPFVGAEKGVIISNEGKSLTLLAEVSPGVKEQVAIVEPTTGTSFATINFGELCAFGEKITVNGVGAVKDCEGKSLVDLVKHLGEEFKPLTKLTINGNAANTVTVDGSAFGFLTGAHEGLTSAGHS